MSKRKVSIEICCGTCRHCKLYGLNNKYICKHAEEPFYYRTKEPCENWVPSKIDVRGCLQRDL